MVCHIQHVARTQARGTQEEQEAVSPLAAASTPRLQQLCGVVVAREARVCGTPRARVDFRAAGPARARGCVKAGNAVGSARARGCVKVWGSFQAQEGLESKWLEA